MTRENKEYFKNNIKNFYISAIESNGGFNLYKDEWILYQAHKIYNISLRTARRYFFQLVSEDIIEEYEY